MAIEINIFIDIAIITLQKHIAKLTFILGHSLHKLAFYSSDGYVNRIQIIEEKKLFR